MLGARAPAPSCLLDSEGRIGARGNVLGRVDPALLQVMQRMRA
jgi:hypothetical protein